MAIWATCAHNIEHCRVPKSPQRSGAYFGTNQCSILCAQHTEITENVKSKNREKGKNFEMALIWTASFK